jgi:ribosomal protein S18 acetylase RimI-like enzyme
MGDSSVALDRLQMLGSTNDVGATTGDGPSDASENPSKKSRVSFDRADAVVIPGGTRMNDIIFLRFLRTSSSPSSAEGVDVLSTCHPEYTHQLFNDEKIYLDMDSSPEVYVDIDIHDLGHGMKIQGTCSSHDLDQITSGLDPIMPKNSVSIEVGEVMRIFDQDDYVFEIRRATHRDPGATQLLRSCEKLAMWFIETADSVDFEDDRWEALFLLGSKKGADGKGTSKKDFVGYFTLYSFINPMAGSKARICQALVLPPFQGRGLGRELMRQVYWICKKRPDVVEITVEDPAPAFEALRDAVDVEWALEHAEMVGIPYDAGAKTLSNAIFADMDKSNAKIAQIMKVTKQQVEFVRDALQYLYISYRKTCEIGSSDVGDSVVDTSTPTIKQWRLDFKRKLIRKLPELKSLPKEEMQKELEALYVEFVERAKPLKNNKRLKELICNLD